MRKNVCLSVLGGCLLAACSSTPKESISGELTGIASDTLLVRSFPITPQGHPDNERLDTVPMQGGKFTLNIPNDVLRQVYIFAMPSSVPNPDGSMPAMSMSVASVLVLPGKQVTVKGSLEDYSLGGDSFYDKYTQVKAGMKPFMQQLDSLSSHCGEMQKNGASPEEIRAAYAPAEDIANKMNQVSIDYIQGHPDEDVSVFLLSQTPMEAKTRYELLNNMSESVKNGLMKPMYEMCKINCEKELARIEAREKVKEGALAPDFTLKDINGKDVALSSLKGKFVVLDFWGSWCGWCVKGFPEMKKAYEKHKAKIEFLGIACNDKEAKWKQAVKENQLPWLNVINTGKPDIAVLYGVSGYPTKMVLDKEGKILKIVIGEDPAFYSYLDELLK